MTKKSDTHTRAMQIADELLEEGIRPTQQNVRERLGSGSLTTINRALNDWWHTLAERVQRRNQHPDLPDPVAKLASQTWDRALAYAENRFEQQRRALEQEQQQLLVHSESLRSGGEQALFEAHKQNARLLERCEQQAEDKRMLEKRILELEESNMRLSSERDNLQREIKQLQRMASATGGSSEEMIELRVRGRVQEEELQRLRDQNHQLAGEVARLRSS